MCGNKKRHRSEIAARYAALAAWNSLKTEFNAYLCPFCRFWHIGKPGRRA
jgi:hypothetical protein